MSFTLPTFPLAVNIYRLASRPPGAPAVITVGNLCAGTRVQAALANVLAATIGTEYVAEVFAYLLLPQATDVRGMNSVAGHDWIEVPAGTGTYWAVGWVYDAGKGFANEHRVAVITQVAPFVDPLP